LSAKPTHTLLSAPLSVIGLVLLNGCASRYVVVIAPTLSCERTDTVQQRASCGRATTYSWSRDNSAIVYPLFLQLGGISGRAHILLWVNSVGQVDSSRVESASNPAFARSVDAAVRRWRFKPSSPDPKAALTTSPRRPLELEVLFGFVDCPLRRTPKPRAYGLRTQLLLEVPACAGWTERRHFGIPLRLPSNPRLLLPGA
jgi:TonB family protein